MNRCPLDQHVRQATIRWCYNAATVAVLWFAFSPPTTSLAQEPAAEEPQGQRAAEDQQIEPVVQNIEGWTVHVHPELVTGAHRDEGRQALKMLANHLQRIAILVPEDRLEKLQQCEFWIQHAHERLGAMQYHPSRRWLVDHGHDPRLAKKIHITHAGELLSRQQMVKHPAVVLHEVAHAYHDQFLGFGEPRIKQAYAEAMEAGGYEEVLLYDDRKVRHYGATDHKEYFAEGTEAYFYRNDFYPFVAAELKQHDRKLYDLMVEIWGPLK